MSLIVRGMKASALILGLALVLASCAKISIPTSKRPPPSAPSVPGALNLTPVSFYQLPGWFDDSIAEALPAFQRSCEVLVRKPADVLLGNGMFGTAGDWRGPCGAAMRLQPGDHNGVRAFFETWFDPAMVSSGNNPTGIFTGYYEAELRGSWAPSAAYNTPIYGPPDNMIAVDLGAFDPDLRKKSIVGRVEGRKLVPYYTRSQIDNGSAGQVARPLMWVSDPVDSFFLHIQGSGRVVMDNGSILRLGYAANNGHRFVGIGTLMRDKGLLAPGKASMQHIRDWLRSNPAQAQALMAENPRYIFFKVIDGAGPIGAEGVALTPGRSMAVDLKFLPLGAPLWLDTTDPDGRPLQRMVIAQDTGGAIKGVVRGDFFWGFGEAALAQAGRMKSQGRYFVLLPKRRTSPTAEGALVPSDGRS